jgi:topoisomerase IV subunit A
MAKKEIKSIKEQFERWFLEYGSHVVLHRAVPHIKDGLKPSQRRVLHSLKEMEDGRYNKVANVVGNTLKYHPHGDASVTETMVGIAQKGLLIDTQGNWGNLLTGDGAAAARYIEARLTPFSKDVVFSPKVTDWTKSYDGRNDEPITLPVKFPLLLAQGTEGIAVSLACKIFPHNFLELCDAAISYLKKETFTLIPDFPQGGEIDASLYENGKSGGKIKVRATIIPHGRNGLEITEIPFGTTTTSLKESIIDAEAKGKIKIKKIHDMTSDKVSLLIELGSGVDQETTKQALYAFTDCEIAHSPIGVVIDDHRPVFLGVDDILKRSVDETKETIKKELELRLEELLARWMKLSLEKLFIEKKAYVVLEKSNSPEEAITHIKKHLDPYLGALRRQITDSDILSLTELPIRRISKYDIKSAEKELEKIELEEIEVNKKLKYLTKTTIAHFENIKSKYGVGRERKTKISKSPFQKIEAEHVTATKEKIYWNREGGFIGTSLKKDEILPFEVTDMTDVVAIGENGTLKVNRPKQKTFFSENLLDARIVKLGEDSPIYNMIYTDKASKKSFIKRFQINGGFTRDRAYLLAGGSADNKVLFLGLQSPEEKAPKVRVKLTPKCGAKIKEFDLDFSEISVKNRESLGNIVTKYDIKEITIA